MIVFLFRGCRGCTSTKAQDLVGEEASVLSYWTSLGSKNGRRYEGNVGYFYPLKVFVKHMYIDKTYDNLCIYSKNGGFLEKKVSPFCYFKKVSRFSYFCQDFWVSILLKFRGCHTPPGKLAARVGNMMRTID